MAEGILDAVGKSELNLGRVGVGSAVARSNQQFVQNDDTLTNALVKIGTTVAGLSIAETKRKQFYEGQSRILKASLEGSQKEELQKIVKEQPYFLSLLGPGAVAEGAIEMAGKVGAGRMFDEQASRLASGQDADVDPETYKESIYAAIEAQQTGDETVDFVFLPQMIASGQRLVATQLTKNMEWKAASTVRAVVEDTWNRVNTLTSVIQKAYGYDATFKSANPETMGDVDRQAHAQLVEALDPENAPKSISKEDYSVLRASILTPEIAKGNVAYYDVMEQAGLIQNLPPKERAELEKARKEGTELNFYNDTQFGEVQRYTLEAAVLDVKSGKDVGEINKHLKTYLDTFRSAGRPLPKEFDSAEKQQAFTLRAIKQLDMYEDKQDAKAQRMLELAKEHQYRLRENAAVEAAKRSQEAAAADQIMRNAVTGNLYAPLAVGNSDGGVSYVAPTQKMIEDTYATFKGRHEQLLYPNGRVDANGVTVIPTKEQQAAAKNFVRQFSGKDSIEQVAASMRVVDPEVKQAGYSLGSRIGAKEPSNSDLGKLDTLLRVDSSDPTYLAAHVQPNVVPMLNKYKRELALEQSYGTPAAEAKLKAWRSSFGRDITKVKDVAKKDVDSIMKQSAIKDVIKASTTNGIAVKAKLQSEVTEMLRSGFTPDEIITEVLPTVTQHSERVAGSSMLDVPFDKTISYRTGFKRPEIVDAAITKYATDSFVARGLAPKKGLRGIQPPAKFELEYDSVNAQHHIVPLNEDGVRMDNLAQPVDYEALKAEVNVLQNAPTATQKQAGKPKQDVVLRKGYYK